jgi:hypothetical protein
MVEIRATGSNQPIVAMGGRDTGMSHRDGSLGHLMRTANVPGRKVGVGMKTHGVTRLRRERFSSPVRAAVFLGSSANTD